MRPRLARLVAVAGDRWVLKGALALDYRLGPDTRTTKDVDLGRSDDEEAATADFLSAQAADFGDFFVFAIQRTDRLDEVREGAAVRYHVDCQLAGRRFDAVTVDVGFGDPIEADPERLHGPDLLLFAGIAPAEVQEVARLLGVIPSDSAAGLRLGALVLAAIGARWTPRPGLRLP
jgi:hypothetical protein